VFIYLPKFDIIKLQIWKGSSTSSEKNHKISRRIDRSEQKMGKNYEERFLMGIFTFGIMAFMYLIVVTNINWMLKDFEIKTTRYEDNTLELFGRYEDSTFKISDNSRVREDWKIPERYYVGREYGAGLQFDIYTYNTNSYIRKTDFRGKTLVVANDPRKTHTKRSLKTGIKVLKEWANIKSNKVKV